MVVICAASYLCPPGRCLRRCPTEAVGRVVERHELIG